MGWAMDEAAVEVVIEPGKGWMPVNLRELWKFRELLYFLAWRDVKVRYKQTALGVLWALIQPLLTMVIFSVLFGRLVRMPSDGAPYPIFVFIGLLPWNYFSSVLGQSTNSLVAGSSLVSKIYFPRLIIPASSAIAALLDLAIGFAVLGAMMIYYGVSISAGTLLLPVLVLLTLMNAIGFGLWFSALNVKYRDIQYVIPFLIQIWMFVTPVIYPRSLFGERWGWLLLLNPMGGVIEAFRPAVLGHMPIPWAALLISSAIGLAVFVGGVFYFKRVERHFADII
ncbi:MAG: ABC transporter permease [Thermodesulfobacteriota bacterium]|nr:MAG: ABC transporter permease [Thermodesulfobacteriota bacterium]